METYPGKDIIRKVSITLFHTRRIGKKLRGKKRKKTLKIVPQSTEILLAIEGL
jgi:hypothetical protein